MQTSTLALRIFYFGFLLVWSAEQLIVGQFALWVIGIVPVAIFAPVVLKGDTRGLSWLGFILLFYFTIAVTNAFQPGKLVTGSLESGFILILFSIILWFIRSKHKQNAAAE